MENDLSFYKSLAIGLLILTGSNGCAVTPSFPTNVNPADKIEFVFDYLPYSNDGYTSLCTKPDITTCKGIVSYTRYYLKRGYIVSQTPAKELNSGLGFYFVILHDGRKLFLATHDIEHKTFGTSSLIRASDYEARIEEERKREAEDQAAKERQESQSRRIHEAWVKKQRDKLLNSFSEPPTGQPLVKGSNIRLDDVDLINNYPYYILSNGEHITETQIMLIRKIYLLRKIKTPKLAELLLHINIAYDKVDNAYRINDLGWTQKPGDLEASIFLTETNNSLTIKATIYNDKWLFIDRLKFVADNFRQALPALYVKRNNTSDLIWETAYLSNNDKTMIAINKMIKGKSSIVRFYGKDYYKDVTLSQKQKNELKTILAVFSYLK